MLASSNAESPLRSNKVRAGHSVAAKCVGIRGSVWPINSSSMAATSLFRTQLNWQSSHDCDVVEPCVDGPIHSHACRRVSKCCKCVDNRRRTRTDHQVTLQMSTSARSTLHHSVSPAVVEGHSVS